MDEEILDLINELIEEISKENNICSDCSIIDSTVKYEKNLYLCFNCQQKRHENAEKVLKDLEYLAEEVEQRLQAIENTERELDQWRDQQLQKNRIFWDEYRRQVENFSASRIRNVQYEFTIKQLKSEKIIKRLKCAQFLIENLDKFRDELNQLIEPTIIQIISSDNFQNDLNSFLLNYQLNNSTTIDQTKLFIQQLSSLDKIILPENYSKFDQIINDDFT